MKRIKEIDDQFFSTMEKFLWTELDNFIKKNIPVKDIQIYIPSYVLKMYDSWQSKYTGTIPDYNSETIRRFRGCKIMDNYDNTIVVSFKDIQLFVESFKPAILPVF